MSEPIKISTEKKAACWKYWDTPFPDRGNKAMFRRSMHISAPTFIELKKEYDSEKDLRILDNTDVMVRIINSRQDKKLIKTSSDEITEDEVRALKRRNYEVAMSQGATKPDRELASKALGLLIDKQEITHKLSPELIERSRKQADEELPIEAEFEELPDKPPELLNANSN